MKITRIRPIAHAAPRRDMRGDGRNYVYVKIETDDGVHGWGEASCGSLAVVAMLEELGRELIGQDAGLIERHWQRLYHVHHNLRGGVIHMAALSGLDMALWDIRAKALGVALHALLGGRLRERLWCYGRFDGATPEAAAAHARREVARGFTALKGDPFRQRGPHLTPAALEAAAAIVRAVRAAVGPAVELLVEAHGRLTVAGATRFLDAIADTRPFLLEEPLPPEDIDGLALLRQNTKVQLAAGERILTKWGFRPLFERRLIDLAQPDPAHAGGITEMRKIAALAEAHHVWMQPHNPY
ncbi:MAG: mandelate racemase/muconate lactonizing enzyme family protein, partial [Alphaproteobacteria bacterium]|nr:mandelate racemase/muconate lactonizing enzyme family protein [Alphaproteobacteria bacterium]